MLSVTSATLAALGAVVGSGAGSPDGVGSAAGGSLVGGSDDGGSEAGGGWLVGGLVASASLADAGGADWAPDVGGVAPTEVEPGGGVAAPVGAEPPAGVDPLSGVVPLVVAHLEVNGPKALAALSPLCEDASSSSAGRTIESSWLGPSVPVGLDSHGAEGLPVSGVKATAGPSPMPPATPDGAALPSPLGAAHIVESLAPCITPPIAGTAARLTRRAAAMARLVGAGMGSRLSRVGDRVNAASTEDAAGVSASP